MATEIERKFLVSGDSWLTQADEGERFRQGYMIGGERASVRVRVSGDRAWLNIKSATIGVTRHEFEYAIPVADAEEMLEALCVKPLIEKRRYRVSFGRHTWEIDCFEGDNEGLVVAAEVELQEADESVELPPWVSTEVSHLPRYYNVCLVEHPYREWTEEERRGL
jgi:adenylate cyclase